VIGGGAAVGAAFASRRTRAAIGRATGLPDVLLGAVEDVIAVSIAALATRTPAELPPAQRQGSA